MARPSFSTLQSLVAFLAGLTSIAGAAYSTLGPFETRPAAGEIVATIRDGSTEEPISGATMQILTTEDRLVTTLRPDDHGAARESVRAGAYRVRVAHPGFVPATLEVTVMPDAAAQVLVLLERRPPPVARASGSRDARARPDGSPAESAARAVDRGVSVGRRLLGRIGF